MFAQHPQPSPNDRIENAARVLNMSSIRSMTSKSRFTTVFVVVTIIAVTMSLGANVARAGCCRGVSSGGECVDFEGLTAANVYNNGDSFVDSGVLMTGVDFQWSGGTWVSSGFATVGNTQSAGGSGLDLVLNNVNIEFALAFPVDGLHLFFGEFGGNVNVEINGDFRNVENMIDLNGLTVGGAQVLVADLGSGLGWLRLDGAISSFAIGGQELSIDDVCPNSECMDFADLPPSTTYVVGDLVVDSGLTGQLLDFQWSNGTWTPDGTATIANNGLAGGTGNDINLNNINLSIDFPETLDGVSFRFGEYGGNINLNVNGDFRNFEDFADIDGLTIGGAVVSVTNGLGNDMGQVRLLGPVDLLSVGGQELWVDDICPETGCIDFEDLADGDTFPWGASLTDSGVTVEMATFFQAGGTPTTTGLCTIDDQQRSGGSGLDANTNNVSLDFQFDSSFTGLSLVYGDLGGTVNLTVDGELRNEADFTILDGQVIGGASVAVAQGVDGKGVLELNGIMNSFIVGGQELWIDDVCIEAILFGDDFESGNTAMWSGVLP